MTICTKWFIFKKIRLVLGTGAVRNRTYRRGRTVSCDSFISIKYLANEPLILIQNVTSNPRRAMNGISIAFTIRSLDYYYEPSVFVTYGLRIGIRHIKTETVRTWIDRLRSGYIIVVQKNRMSPIIG